jgi:hypothetical protein
MGHNTSRLLKNRCSAIREAQFSGIERGYFQSLAPGSVSLFPAIGKPGVDVVCRPRGEIHQQLHEVELRIHLVPAAAAGQAGQDRCGPSAARVSDEQRVAMLKRREGETLAQLLTRLDLAIGKAFTEDVFTDEINTPLRNSHRR